MVYPHYERRARTTRWIRALAWSVLIANGVCALLLHSDACAVATIAVAAALTLEHRYGYSVVIREHDACPYR